MNSYKSKENQLFSKLLIPLTALTLIFNVGVLFSDINTLSIINWIFLCGLIFSYGLFRTRQLTISKSLILLLLNLNLSHAVSIYSIAPGFYLFLIPLTVFPLVLFNKTEKSVRNLYIMLPTILLISYLLFFKSIVRNSIEINPEIIEIVLHSNLITSIILTIGILYYFVSLTDQIFNKLSCITNELRRKNIELLNIKAEVDSLIYTTSHDLSAPLTSIEGLTLLAQHENNNLQTDLYLNKIIEQAKKMKNFIIESIEYYKQSNSDYKMEKININDLINELIENLLYLKGVDEIEFIKIIPSAHECIIINKFRISTILNNLISNAIKYHDFSKERCWIKIEIKKNDDNLIITIKDNGKGIEEKYLDRIFEIFYRGQGNKREGNGIGLSIVKNAIEKINAEIQVESKLGEGTSFIITIPFTVKITDKLLLDEISPN